MLSALTVLSSLTCSTVPSQPQQLAPTAPACVTYDDGTADNLLGFTAGGDLVWVNRFGAPGVNTTIVSVEVAWPTGAGAATNVVVWQDDPSQDGSPLGGTIVLNLPTTISGGGAYVTFPAPLTINGYFFVGTHQSHTPGQFVAPIDMTSHLYTDSSWFFGSNVPGQAANLANPGANTVPPHSLELVGPGQFLVRIDCGPALYLCDPGSSGTLPCPCANPPSSLGRGCDNSSSTGGAAITGAGNPSVAASTLVFTTANEKPTALTILLQGTTLNASGIVFGQGIRCAAGVLKRLYTHTAVGGSITAPSGTDPAVPTRSAALGDPISAGQHRYYLAYYRDATVLGGCSALSTFNDTNTADVLWAP